LWSTRRYTLSVIHTELSTVLELIEFRPWWRFWQTDAYRVIWTRNVKELSA